MTELSKFQQSILAAESLFPGTSAFNIGGYIRVSAPLDHDAFRMTVARLWMEFPALRVQLDRQDMGDSFVQGVADSAVFAASRIVSTSSEAEALQLMMEEMEAPFRLESSPLCEIHLFDVAGKQSFAFLKMHHAIGDGFGIKLVCERFCQLYKGFATGEQSEVAMRPSMLPAYVKAEARYLASPEAERAVEYWRGKFKGVPDARGFETLFDAGDPTDLSYERTCFRIPAELQARAEEFARANGNLGVFSLFVAAIYVLNRITDNDDFIAGLSTLTRSGAAMKEAVGPFMNVIPFVCQTGGDLSFLEVAGAVARGLKESYRHMKMPLFSLTERLNRKTRLYTIGISYQKFEYALDLPDMEPELQFAPNNCQHEDVVFHLMHDTAREGLNLLIDARCALLTPGKVDYLGQRLVTLLEECLKAPEKPLRELEPAALGERDYILGVLNNTERAFPAERTVMDVVDDQGAATPDAVAVSDLEGELTYAELAERSRSLAGSLLSVTDARTVGVFMQRSRALVIALHGIVRAGKAYVPMSSEFPQQRLQYIRANAAFDTVLVDAESADLIRESLPDVRVVVVDAHLTGIACPSDVRLPRLEPDGWAYVIYTSGSTGEPKGVVNIHRSLHNRIHWQQREIPIGPTDVVLQKTPYTFDVSVWEFFWPFMTGASLHMLAPDGHKDPRFILATIFDRKVTTLHFVPSMLRLFVEVFTEELARSLRNVIVSGEELPVDVQNDFLQRSPARLVNLYGPTEAAIDVTCWNCSIDRDRHAVPIGYPIDNTQILILNRFGRMLPVGAVGEIHIGGVNVSLGYMGNPELTAEKFIDNPFGASRLYKTGDLGKWHADGFIDYHGRIDNQLKLNGLRIELGEIDTRLKEMPWILDAKTVARTNGGRKSLVGFRVFDTYSAEVAAETSARLRDVMPAHMVPSLLVPVDAIPLSMNGKADVKALCALPIALAEAEYVPPVTEAEKSVAALMATVLGLERIGVTNDFFEMGGTSLLAISFVSRYKHITLQQFYAAPTVRGVLAQNAGEQDRKLLRLAEPTGSDVNLIFVPYGGGTVFVYNDLAEAIRRGGSDTNMFAVDVDRSTTDLAQVAADVVAEMEREGLLAADKRLFLFGHCVGSALATAIGFELQRRQVKVDALLVGGYIAGLPRWLSFVMERVQSFIYRKDARVRRFMKNIGFHDPDALDQVEDRMLFDDFRFDGYRARDFYRAKVEERLDAKLYLVLGEKDPLTKPIECFCKGWKRYVAGPITVARIQDARHYFIHTEAEHVADLVTGVLAAHQTH